MSYKIKVIYFKTKPWEMEKWCDKFKKHYLTEIEWCSVTSPYLGPLESKKW